MPGRQLHKMGAAEERSSVEGAAPCMPSGEADFREEGVRSMFDGADMPNTGRARHQLSHLAGWRALVTLRYKGAIHSLTRRITVSLARFRVAFFFLKRKGGSGAQKVVCMRV